jgi:acylphosphatase
MICRRYVVIGRVQGVFYRASTQEAALRLGLVGWVRNCDDGSVELVACGEEPVLQQLENWLWQGPKYADVSAVEVSAVDLDMDSGFSDFSIRY